MRYLLILFGLGLAVFALFAATGNSVINNFSFAGETRAPEKIFSSWGKTLNPAGIIPNEGFKAIYFSRGDATSAVFSENTENIAIKYSWNDFHGIASQSFGAYWVGQLSFDSPVRKQISISQSWAKSRIFIDGEVVFDSKKGGSKFIHEFTEGDHIVEVEYANNWHTVEFKVTIQDVVSAMDTEELADHFARTLVPNSELHYFGIYESANRDTSIEIENPSSGNSTVLWLSSHEAVDWKLSSDDNITAVVVTSNSPGSRVAGVSANRVIYTTGWQGIFSEVNQCSCSRGYYHCEGNDDLIGVTERLLDTTGLNLSSYAIKYSAAALATRPYTESVQQRILAKKTENEDQKSFCEGEADPDFDSMMDEW